DERIVASLAAELRQLGVLELKVQLEMVARHELVRDERARPDEIALVQMGAVVLVVALRILSRRNLVIAERDGFLELCLELLNSVLGIRESSEELRDAAHDPILRGHEALPHFVRRPGEEAWIAFQELAEICQRSRKPDLLAQRVQLLVQLADRLEPGLMNF